MKKKLFFLLSFNILMSCNNSEDFYTLAKDNKDKTAKEQAISERNSESTYCFPPERILADTKPRALSFILEDNYCVKIYVHVMRRSNGTGGQSIASVYESISILGDMKLNTAGSNLINISLVWDNQIDYIDNDRFYNLNSNAIFDENSINNLHTDGIDIYLFDDEVPYEIAPGSSVMGLKQAIRIGSKSLGIPAAKTNIIAHEIGHIFGLVHTSDSIACPSSSDCSENGDGICDTPYDPGMNLDVDPNTCEWLGIPPNNCSTITVFNPDEKNNMAISHPSCIEYFTPGQDLKMRETISESEGDATANLYNTVVDCDECSTHEVFNLTNELDGRTPYWSCRGCVFFSWDYTYKLNTDVIEYEFEYEKREIIGGNINYTLIYTDTISFNVNNNYPYVSYPVSNWQVLLQGDSGGRWRVRTKNDDNNCNWSAWKERN